MGTGKTKTSTGKVHLMVTSPETTRTVPEMRKTREAAAVTQEVRRAAHQAVAKSKKMNSNSNSLSLSAKDQAHLTLKKVPVLKIRKVPEMSPRRAAAVAHVAHAQTSPKTMKTSLETRKVPKTTRTKMIRTKSSNSLRDVVQDHPETMKTSLETMKTSLETMKTSLETMKTSPETRKVPK